MDAEGNGLAGGLVAGDTLDVDDIFETVDGGDLALTALVGATDDGDLVVLADGDAADLLRAKSVIDRARRLQRGWSYVVLLTELLGERGAHDVATLRRGSLVVSGTALPARGVDDCIALSEIALESK